MQAIQTKFIPCTNHRGSRVKAWCEAKSLTVYWDHALDVDGNHNSAARQLIKLLGWEGHGLWFGGELPRPSSGYVFVCNPKHNSSHLNIV